MSNKPPSFDGKTVRQLAEILKETDLTEIEYEVEGCRIYVARQGTQQMVMAPAPMHSHQHVPAAPQMPAPSKVPEVKDHASHPGAVKSPMVGTVYRSPTPGTASFVEVGGQVKKDQTILIIEAMKVMNQIRAPKDGTVVEILCKDSEPVEFGQVLMVIE